MQILLGTTNPSKVRMFERWLEEYPVTFVTPDQLGITEAPPEDGRTPAENARAKAAFYGQYAPYVITNDAGLFLEKLPMEDERQPGLHIRSPYGVRLNDDQMIEYYADLVHSLGGETRACYLNGFAIQTPKGLVTYAEPMELALRQGFWMVDTPSQARHEGWPLDALSWNLDRSHCFTDADYTASGCSDQAKDEALSLWLSFLKKSLEL